MQRVPNWIDGRPVVVETGPTTEVTNPATGEVVAEVAATPDDQVVAAIESARRAQVSWAATSLPKRAAVMYNMRRLLIEQADELADIIVREGGKTKGDALGEIARGRESVEFACSITSALKGEFTSQAASGVDVHTLRQPVGVVAGVCPFNFPVMVPMWMHPLALATGNAFVLKPATPVPSASGFIAKLYQEAGLPDGLFQVVNGERTVVTQLLTATGVDAVSFVGSTPVAHIIADTGTSHGKRVQALGGANNHAIVMPDADLEFAAQHVASGAFGAAGQRCMALPLVVTVGDIGDTFVQLVKQRAEQLVVGPGWDPASDVGPVISAAARDRIVSWVDEAEQAGAQVVVDGRGYRPADASLRNGYWVGPTVVDRLPLETTLYREEVFGPVLGVVRVDSYDEAIRILNAGPYGNGAAVFTSSGGTARRFTLDANAGMVGVNVPIPVPVGYYSFGGWKESLIGDTKIHGPEGVEFYTKAKVITTRWPETGHSAASLNFAETH